MINLNPQQKEAVSCPQGPLLIVAGAGTGKTTTLTSRLVHLVESGISPRSICAITFTNKAAREMADRISEFRRQMSDVRNLKSEIRNPFIGTFHGLGASILRREAKLLDRTPNFVIFDDHDSFDLLKKIVKAKTNNEERSEQDKPGFFAKKIAAIKNTDATLFDLQASKKEKDALILEVFAAYESKLKENNAFDFDDLIEKVVSLFKKYPDVLKKYQEKFRALLVDEYQDVNPKQYELVKLLAQEHKNISVVGDDEQMIYGWRYANLRIFLGFEKDWPRAQIKFLEENYRSTKNIVSGASAVASNNNYRRPKNLWTKNPEGAQIEIFEAFDENHEAEWIASRISDARDRMSEIGDQMSDIRDLKSGIRYPSTAVLYRTNAQSRAIEQGLIKNQIPYRIFGGLRFYERKEIKDIIAGLRCAVNRKDEISRDRLEKNISKRRLQQFLEEAVRAENKNLSPAQWVELFLKTTDYLGQLEREFMNYAERQENIGELLSFATTFDDLNTFLENVALMQPADNLVTRNQAPGTGRAKPEARNLAPETQLMTIHLAKGLEFDNVFVAGCVEGILPHAMSMENEYQLEEERRLMYVAMTRARKNLSLSSYNTPSRFLGELPNELVSLKTLDADVIDEEHVEID